MVIKKKAVKFGDNINTDVILPGKYLELIDPKELGKHAMEGIDPSFSSRIRDGAVLIGGKNFGCGSSREQAPIALKNAGVECVVSEYFARIFYRNCINIGLPAIECENISENVEEEDVISVNLEKGLVINESKDLTYNTTPIPEFLMTILQEGGLIEHLKKELETEGNS